jgi:O-methyltransferase
MVFDDYGEPTCPGARKAVDEFFADKPETPIYIPTGQCLVHRLPE